MMCSVKQLQSLQLEAAILEAAILEAAKNFTRSPKSQHQ